MNLHAFDPGTRLGWAFWGEGSDKPTSRLIDLRAEREGATYCRARAKLIEVVCRGDCIAIEGALLPPGMTIESRLVLYGVRAIIFQVAFEAGITPVEYPPQVWRSRYMGLTKAPKTVPKKRRREWIKARAQQEAQARGWGGVGPDEADALGMLHCLRYDIDPEYRKRGTLFEGRDA